MGDNKTWEIKVLSNAKEVIWRKLFEQQQVWQTDQVEQERFSQFLRPPFTCEYPQELVRIYVQIITHL